MGLFSLLRVESSANKNEKSKFQWHILSPEKPNLIKGLFIYLLLLLITITNIIIYSLLIIYLHPTQGLFLLDMTPKPHSKLIISITSDKLLFSPLSAPAQVDIQVELVIVS